MASKLLSYRFAKRHGVIADIHTQPIQLFYCDSINKTVMQECRRFYQAELEFIKIDAENFQQKLQTIYEQSSTNLQDVAGLEEELNLENLAAQIPENADLLDNQDDAPIIRLLNALFTQAIKMAASDIHIESFAKDTVVRFRIDGVMREMIRVQRVLAPMIVSRIKVMSKLDIAEKRIPQDGRMSISLANHTIDVRISTIPSNHGERVVLRILDKKQAQLDLTALGMAADTLDICQRLIAQPNGIILVTGPTGSGKTTSLYAMLTALNEPSRNILTVEDPIEYDLAGIGQMQVNNKVNMTFAKGLRAMLRQDPDVVMVGEIRDLETAQIAVQASLTGHLVLSTLHTNSALGAIPRLRDMGVESFLLASSLIGLIAQRLLRLLCPHCKQAVTTDEQQQTMLQLDSPATIYTQVGCEHCNHSGYLGRTGIYEVIAINEQIKNMIHNQANEQQLRDVCRQFSRSMYQDGIRKILAGDTSLDELLRVIQ